MIIEIDDKLVSSEIFRVKFTCNLAVCKGICCVEGNAGAPLEAEEVEILRKEYPNYKPYLKPGGIRSLERHGFSVLDSDGDLTTPLIEGEECAYCCESDGITFCAIERAWLEGKTEFRKPISCHLYPIRVSRFRNGTYALNYHKWDVCHCALKKGETTGLSVYRALREPLIRAFGEEFYLALEQTEKALEGSI